MTWIHLFIVKPNYDWRSFPIDMLRYDTCYPATEEDSVKIAESLTEKPVRVCLKQISQSQKPKVTEDRWESFGWTVEEEIVTRKA